MRVLKRLRRPCLAALSATLLVAGMSAPVSAVINEEPSEHDATDTATDNDEFTKESDTGRWIVRLDAAPLASYRGGVDGIPATSPNVTGHAQVDADSPDSVAYLDHLADGHDVAIAEIEKTLGRTVEIAHEYRTALNGLAVDMTADEAARVATMADVAEVLPDEVREVDTDASNDIVSSPAVWNGQTASGVGTRGEGVIVGMIDTGVNPDHPSFAATDGEGYTHTNPFGAGTYVGVCDPTHSHHDPMCNDKLIGAWDFTSTVPNARDEQGHGSHTGATMAGNTHDAVVTLGDDEHIRTVSGVAPRANVISYKSCGFFGCFSSDSVAAVDQAILDGVDVLNYSISGGDSPWDDAVDLAFLEAHEAGIFVAASAGNSGPGEGTVAKTAPWNASIAATANQRVIANAVDVTGPDPVPEALTGMAGVLGGGSVLAEAVEAPVRFVGPVDAENQGCEPFEDGAVDGAIALIKRGGCDFADKIDNASAAGAVGVVVFNQFAGPPVVMGGLEDTTVPGLMVSNSEGLALRDHVIATDAPVTLRLGVDSTLTLDSRWADVVADFSARGPSQHNLLAPTIAAPGRNILAASAADGDDAAQYEILQGTSMASPHAAGAGALLTALHPNWTPAAIRSAMATSADRDDLVKEDGETPADPFDVGSGRLDLAEASRVGVVFDETPDNFAAADPADGGAPETLNVPSLVDHACDQSCTWTRTVTSVADTPVTYTAAGVAPDGMSVTVSPSTFTVQPGESQSVDITMDVSGPTGTWLFGSAELTTDDSHADGPPVSDTHLPIAAYQPEPEMTVDPSGLESQQDVAQQVPQEVTITNSGGKALEWQVDTAGDCALPTWASVSPDSGTVDPHADSDIEVTFDSTDMTAGDYEATVCITSNDPHTPSATVDLTLTVVEIPVVDVTDGAVDKTQPAGTVTGGTFEIGNDGWGTLNWTLTDEDAGPSEERIQMLRDGVLLAPNSWFGETSVMAFNPDTGDLMDASFMEDMAFDPDELIFTPKQVLPTLDNTGFLVVDQFQDVVAEYDLSGQFRRVYAPSGGPSDEIMSNIRGIAWSPEDTLLVTSGFGANGDSVLEFDADGNFVGQYISAETDGLDGPWGVLVRDDDILVAGQGSAAIHRFAFDGTANGRFAEEMPWTQQLAHMDNGNVLAANYANGSSDVYEFDGEGTELGRYDVPGRSTGAHPLGNGNIIVSSDEGVFEISRDGTVQETKSDEPSVEYFTEVQMPEAQTCSTPDEVPWLSVSAAEGAVDSGSTDEVTVSLDSTGLDAGDYAAQLCVTSDDPDMPLVTVPVQMTVTDAACTTTVADAHVGSLRADSGLLCLGYGSSVSGPVRVTDGAGIFADAATMNGPVSIVGAGTVDVHATMVNGPVHITDSSGPLAFRANHVRGPVRIAGNDTGDAAIVVAGNTVSGPLSCSRNTPAPVNDGDPNEVGGPRSGQCADL